MKTAAELSDTNKSRGLSNSTQSTGQFSLKEKNKHCRIEPEVTTHLMRELLTCVFVYTIWPGRGVHYANWVNETKIK